MEQLNDTLRNNWHGAINAFASNNKPFPTFMYRAKDLAEEVPRMAMLFGMEREGKLAKTHHQCSHDTEGTPVTDNHLSCALGVKCRECPFLAALDTATVTDADRDVLKAWTCAAHIMTDGTGFDTSVGFILTVDDKMYWQRLHDNLAKMAEEDEDD